MAEALATAMMQALRDMQTTNQAMLAEIARLAGAGGGPRDSLVDTRGMGRPPSFSGNEKEWREWCGKMTAYLLASDPAMEATLKWLEGCNVPITAEAISEALCLDMHGHVVETHVATATKMNKRLHLVLMDVCKGEPFRIVQSAGQGSGFEAWRLLMRRYNSKTPGTKRALLQALFSLKPAASPEAFEGLLLTIEETIRRYDSMAESTMSEDIRCAILVSCCPKDLKDHLDMSVDEFVYVDLRNKVNTWIERKREHHAKGLAQMEHRQSGGPAPMDVSAAQWTQWEYDQWDEASVDSVHNWGGYTHSRNPQWTDSQLTEEELYYFHKGGKSKGKGKGKYGGKGGGKPSKGGGKGGKSAGKGKSDGKGKGGYNGACHWCGIWGHTARYCRSKDQFMDAQRAAQANGVEEHEEYHEQQVPPTVPEDSSLSGLEATAGDTYRNMDAHFDLGTLLKSNRYAALSPEELDHQEDQHFQPLPSAQPLFTKTRRLPTVRWVTRRGAPLPTLREHEVSNMETDWVKHVDLTIDSGAAEHVVGPKDMPHVPVTHSRAKDVEYIMANGKRIANSGEQHVSATTPSGHTCNFTAQVTAVHKPLMSVSRICDGGNRVVFEAAGGYIESLTNGTKIDIRRENNVYRLRVGVSGEGFPRQGNSRCL